MSSGAGFTKGPWLIHAERRWIVPAEDAFKEPIDALPICQLRDPDERLTEDETLANGFLIAAAPNGYAVVERLVEHLRGDFRIPDNADEGWVVDSLGHGLGGIYLDALAYLSAARGDHE